MVSATEILLGIDGGGTRTRAWIARSDGTVLGRGVAGPSNAYELGIDRSRRAIAEAVQMAWRQTSLPGEKPCAFCAVFAGVAGAGSVDDQRDLAAALAAEFGVNRDSVCVDHDLRIAQAGALAGSPGAVLLAGTGSACYGRAMSGASWKAGGWGPILDDGGSGYWLGIQAMRTVIRAADGRIQGGGFTRRVCETLAIERPREMIERLRPGNPVAFDRAAIAKLAPMVLAAAAAGEPLAREIANRGAEELAEMAGAVIERLEHEPGFTPRLGAAGGLFENHADYRRRTAAAVAARLPGVQLESAMLSGVAGAVLLAIELTGRVLSPEVVQQVTAAGSESA